MICTNKRCGIDIKAPLELYNGDLACPKCRQRVILMLDEVKVTPENKELYELSNMWFSYGLSKDVDTSVPELAMGIRLSPKEMIRKATLLATEASLLGHPEARWRLGFFFDRDFVENDKTESARCRIAAKYYESVFASPEGEFAGYGAPETLALKKRAAKDYIDMVSGMPESERDFYKDGFEKATVIAPEAVGEFGSGGAQRSDKEIMADVIKLLPNASRAPLFGIVTVDKNSLGDIGELINESRGIIRQDVSFQFIPLNKDGTMHGDFDTSAFILSDIEDYVKRAEAAADTEVSVFFYNKLGRHRFVKNKKAELGDYVQALFDKSAINYLQILVNKLSATKVTLFYDDDIAFYNAKNPKDAYRRLVSALAENGG